MKTIIISFILSQTLYAKDLIVKFKNKNVTNNKNFVLLSSELNIYLVKNSARNLLDHAQIESLEEDSELELDEFDSLPNDPGVHRQWGIYHDQLPISHVNVLEVWKKHRGSKNVIVAVIDSGINYLDPDLSKNMWINEKEKNGIKGIDDDKNGFVDDIYGYDFFSEDSDPKDETGHGSHVAGIIGARGNNNIDGSGVNQKVSMMALKIFGKETKSAKVSRAIAAINYAIDKKVKVINGSFGNASGSIFHSTLLKEIIELAGKKGILYVSTSGNLTKNIDLDPHFPGSFDCENIINVSALERSGALASFSNFGKNSVDLAAPGMNILSSTHYSGGGLVYNSGSSMAAPFVSGAIALIYSVYPKLNHLIVKKALLQSTRKISVLQGTSKTSGILDVSTTFKNLEKP